MAMVRFLDRRRYLNKNSITGVSIGGHERAFDADI